MTLGQWLTIGCGFGIVSYLFACAFKSVKPQPFPAIMSIFAGGGIIAGFHLLCCVWDPTQLFRLKIDSGNNPIDVTRIHLELDGLHVVDIFAGGVAVIWVTITHLWSLWIKPTHQ